MQDPTIQLISRVSLGLLSAGFVFGPSERMVNAATHPGDVGALSLGFFALLCAVLFFFGVIPMFGGGRD